MLELKAKHHLGGKVWHPINIKSKFILQQLINKDSVDDRKLEQLEELAESHGLEISCVH